jgi:hypothetical protein
MYPSYRTGVVSSCPFGEWFVYFEEDGSSWRFLRFHAVYVLLGLRYDTLRIWIYDKVEESIYMPFAEDGNRVNYTDASRFVGYNWWILCPDKWDWVYRKDIKLVERSEWNLFVRAHTYPHRNGTEVCGYICKLSLYTHRGYHGYRNSASICSSLKTCCAITINVKH